MLTIIGFSLIYAVMLFITTYVYLNRSNNEINQAFLAFMGVLMTWMVLSVSIGYNINSSTPLIVNTIYWWSMMSLSVLFLNFVYRFIGKKLDLPFYLLLVLNTLTIFSRYLFPIDYSEKAFWRLSTPIVAPLMSMIFSLPAIFALYLIIRQFFLSKSAQQKAQLRIMFFGIGISLIISILSEYALPVLFHIDKQLSLMYLALLIFSVSIFFAIMRHRLLSISTDYIYRKMFLNSGDGIIIINKNNKIININNVAKEIFRSDDMDIGDMITDYIKDYSFEANYNRQEIEYFTAGRQIFLSISQHPIDIEDEDPVKLLSIADITASKLRQMEEHNLLIRRSSIDELTGLYSKQNLLDSYNNESEDTPPTKKAVIFVDVDDFKTINDLFGHLVGDNTLTAVAGCIRDCVGENAKAYRFGGDEFVVVLDSPAKNETLNLAERIRSSIKSHAFANGYLRFELSVSIGLVEGAEPLKSLVDKADIAMYNSKGGGKNKTTVYSGDTKSFS